MVILLPLLVSLGWGSALSFFAFWVFSRLSESYAAGSRLLSRFEGGDGADRKILPLIDMIEKLTPFILPAVLYLEETNPFGIALYLEASDRQLKRAGLRATLTPRKFFTYTLTFALAAAAASSLAFVALGARIGAILLFVLVLATCLPLPGMLLKSAANSRILRIEKRLPFAIEFMLLSMQANTSFAAILETFCDQFQTEPLGIEFRKVLDDIGLGTSFAAGINRMAERLQSEDINTFVTALITGVKEGQPMQEVLQIQADAAHQRRFHNAEQIAKAADANATPFLVLSAVGLLLLLLGPLVISVSDQSLF